MINAIADFFQNIFSPLVDIMGAVLLYFHQQLGLEWWLAIVLLTVLVRTLLFSSHGAAGSQHEGDARTTTGNGEDPQQVQR